MAVIVVRGESGLAGVGETEETARLDLEAQRAGVPAWQLLGGTDPSPRPIGQVCFDRSEIARARAAGVKTIKIKSLDLGAPASERDYALRVDLNGRRELARAIALEPELIEEPGELYELESPPPVPLAADESLALEGGVERALGLVRRGIVSALVLKPARLGFARALEIARRARQEGAEVIVTHIFDGPLGHAAATHLAFALPSGRFAHGLGLHAGLSPVDVPHVSGGVALAPRSSGVLAPELRHRMLGSG